MSYLLDTNVISEIRRGKDANVARWAATVVTDDLYLSVLSIGEVRKGIERLRPRDPARAAQFEGWLDQLLRQFGSRILPIDAASADLWGRLNAVRDRPTVDSLLAASATVHGLTIVTRNTEHFASLGVPILNPWTATT